MFLWGWSGMRSKYTVVIILIFCGLVFLTLDFYLFSLIQATSGPLPLNFNNSAQPCTDISPFCFLDTKTLLLDWMNFYVHQPLASLIHSHFSKVLNHFSANGISYFHAVVAGVSARLITEESLLTRRMGVIVYEFRNFLDELDGTVAKSRPAGDNNLSGYYIDGVCDGIGTILLIVAIKKFLKKRCLKNNEYSLITPAAASNGRSHLKREVSWIFCQYQKLFPFCRSGTISLPSKVVWVGIQLLMNSVCWNRYIVQFTNIFEKSSSGSSIFNMAEDHLRVPYTYVSFLMWRALSVHGVVEIILLSIFFDKMAEIIEFLYAFGWILIAASSSLAESLVFRFADVS